MRLASRKKAIAVSMKPTWLRKNTRGVVSLMERKTAMPVVIMSDNPRKRFIVLIASASAASGHFTDEGLQTLH